MKTEVDMFAYERSLRERGAWLIGGMDEAGRGPLAGPVVAAAVIMPSDDPIEGVNDSKQLSEKKRERLYDEINILNATKRAMAECVEGFAINPHVVLVDAVKLSLEVPTVSIIKGDALSYSIAAASILAKVYRDRLMLAYDEQYPEYGFARHKGYGTREHIEALRKYGPCPIHRHSFITHFITDDE